MRFRFESTVATRIDTAFAFHEDPANLARLHADWPGFRILHHSGNVHPGSETWFEQTIAHVVPLVMGFRHTVYEPPNRFAEQMIHGPFLRFNHTHEFESVGQRVIVRDLLDVAMPRQMRGLFFWCLMALFFVDIVISIVDFALERKSRQFIGGLPSGEYVLHMLIAMLFGALVTSIWMSVNPWLRMPTELVYAPADVPWILRTVMGVMAILVMASGVQDLVAAIRLTGRQPVSRSMGEQ